VEVTLEIEDREKHVTIGKITADAVRVHITGAANVVQQTWMAAAAVTMVADRALQIQCVCTSQVRLIQMAAAAAATTAVDSSV
jgi:hypothetical protein